MIRYIKQYLNFVNEITNNILEEESEAFSKFRIEQNIGKSIAIFFISLLQLIISVLSLIQTPIFLIFQLYIEWYDKKYVEKARLNKAKCVKEMISRYQKTLDRTYPYKLANAIDNSNLDYYVKHNFSLDNFVRFFLFSLNNQYSTYSRSNELICGPGRRRSLGDIYLICKCYYPTCTLEDVLSELITLVRTDRLSITWCGTINKCVFTYQSNTQAIDCRLEYSIDYKFRDLMETYENYKTN